MKKWSGGTLIVGLALVLFLRYSFLIQTSETPTPPSEKQQQKKKKKSTQWEFSRPKPHLIPNLEGLLDLFSPPIINFTESEHRSKLVWDQTRDLLARSDALPETASGVKEASVAWKELVEAVQIERSSSSSSSVVAANTTENNDCPYSVHSSLLSTWSGARQLGFPCGLAEDSAVTVVGIPSAGNGGSISFQIELVGSRLPGERNPPVVLHYGVSLGGKDGGFIVQNSWTEKDGWGVEERCPSHAYKNDRKIDGLVRCNEEVVGTVDKENINATATEFNSSKSLNGSKGSAHLTGNFLFVEGEPFTATIWAGREGFHMTVNGKHETSFAYRERLEPWLTSGVRVAGDLVLLSCLADGLPVSEDQDLVIGIQNLKAPLVSKKRLFMLVGVFSTGNNFERRMALRRSWMQYEAVRSGVVAVRFFTGLDKNRQVNLKLWKEAQTYGDIQLMPFVDYYSLITLKTIAICILGAKILPSKYIMKTDDDAFVRIDEVISTLKKGETNGLLYGFISFESEPRRDKESKWYITSEEWPHSSYPPWAHGPGYIISQDIAEFIVQGHQERNLQLFKLEDVAMGIWIQEFKKAGHEVHYVNDDHFHNEGCEGGYVLVHYQGPRLLLCLWQKLQMEHQPICCE